MNRLALLFVVLFALGLSTYAQFKKGARMVGTSIGTFLYSNENAEVSFPPPTVGFDRKSSRFGAQITPSMAWFINEHTAIGAAFNINFLKSKVTFESGGSTFARDEENSFDFGIGGFVRNYFGNASDFMPFGQFNLGAGIRTSKIEGFIIGEDPGLYREDYSGKSSGGFVARLGLSFGMTKMLNPNTGLDFSAGYNFTHGSSKMKTTTLRDELANGSIDETRISEPTTKSNEHGFMIAVGFQVFLEKRK
jgi:hypothetical protein